MGLFDTYNVNCTSFELRRGKKIHAIGFVELVAVHLFLKQQKRIKFASKSTP